MEKLENAGETTGVMSTPVVMFEDKVLEFELWGCRDAPCNFPIEEAVYFKPGDTWTAG